jgi:hypothetical protein
MVQLLIINPRQEQHAVIEAITFPTALHQAIPRSFHGIDMFGNEIYVVI